MKRRKVRDKERWNEVYLPTMQTWAELYGKFVCLCRTAKNAFGKFVCSRNRKTGESMITEINMD